MLFRKENQEKSGTVPNLLTIVPDRNVDWKETEDGKIDLIKPKYSNIHIRHLVDRLMKEPHYTVHLDEVGSFIWHQIDGQRTVEIIGREMQQNFGERIEPVFDRLAQFIHSLHSGKFILLKNI